MTFVNVAVIAAVVVFVVVVVYLCCTDVDPVCCIRSASPCRASSRPASARLVVGDSHFRDTRYT